MITALSSGLSRNSTQLQLQTEWHSRHAEIKADQTYEDKERLCLHPLKSKFEIKLSTGKYYPYVHETTIHNARCTSIYVILMEYITDM